MSILNYDRLKEALGLSPDLGSHGWTDEPSLHGVITELRLAIRLLEAKEIRVRFARMDKEDQKRVTETTE